MLGIKKIAIENAVQELQSPSREDVLRIAVQEAHAMKQSGQVEHDDEYSERFVQVVNASLASENFYVAPNGVDKAHLTW